jgi:FKBP12-rapamycin complex-associated protein
VDSGVAAVRPTTSDTAATAGGGGSTRRIVPTAASAESDGSSSDEEVVAARTDTRYETIQSLANSHVLSGSHHVPSSMRSLRRHVGPDDNDVAGQPFAVNEKALAVVKRVQDKLTGRDFADTDPVSLRRLWGDTAMESKSSCSVAAQVDMLIRQATSNERLCQCFVGWCPFW